MLQGESVSLGYRLSLSVVLFLWKRNGCVGKQKKFMICLVSVQEDWYAKKEDNEKNKE